MCVWPRVRPRTPSPVETELEHERHDHGNECVNDSIPPGLCDECCLNCTTPQANAIHNAIQEMTTKVNSVGAHTALCVSLLTCDVSRWRPLEDTMELVWYPGECLNGCNVARLSLDDSMYDVARVGYDAFGLSDYLPYLINCLCRRELLLLS